MPKVDRFRMDMEALAQIGRIPEGGVARFSLTPADIEGRNLVISIMKQLGLSVKVDAIGNIRGRREGQDPTLPLVMMGSHIDSVPNGGDYDGPTGVMGALEIVRSLDDNNVKTRHPIEVVAFTDEEGVRFKKGTMGSAALTGAWPIEELYKLTDQNGVTVKEALTAIDIDGSSENLPMKPSEVKSFVELHVEQSALLDEIGVPIGIVQAITGSYHGLVTVVGKADHAGATPMNRRTDALVAASQMVQEVERIGRSDPAESLVATVGYMDVQPGATNIVPGLVTFTLDIRDTSVSTLESAIEETKRAIHSIAEEREVECSVVDTEYVPAVDMSTTVKDAISQACSHLGLQATDIQSRAVHDTSHMARIADAGMIFVPSVDGKSHSPDELTNWEDIAPGLEVLYEVTLTLAEVVD